MVVVVFDLDDTLYDDMTYVLSGFHTVANYLAPIVGESSKKIFQRLKQLVEQDRNFVFDRFLKEKGLFTKTLVKHLLSLYRSHTPTISLYKEANACLKRLSHLPLYLVTDGNKLVQKNKIKALGLYPIMRKCFLTSNYGLKYVKPSPYCFEKICKLEKVSPQEVIYVADNPTKDFVGIKPLGFQTVRVLTGNKRNLRLDKAHEADITINSLQELNEKLFKRKNK